MRAFVFFLSALFISVASADEARRNQLLQTCQSELSLKDDIIAFANSKKEAVSEHERCFIECFYGKLNLIKDGKFSHEGSDALAKERFGDKTELIQKAHEIFEKCQSSYTPSNEKCSLGKHIRSCFVQHDSEQLNFFPHKQ